MENHGTLALFASALVFGALIPAPLFAYERDTHKGVSKATVEAYERLKREVFNSNEKEQIIRGSFDEDDGSRPLNHFYDPINSRGLTVLFNSWPQSRLWAQDTEAQANYCDWSLCSKRVGYNDKHFSSPTDYSWERAIYEYVYGDRNRGLRALGHVLHLLQDSSVPAHVRNDQHLNHQGVGDPDPYEKFSGKFGLGGVNVPAGLENIPTYQSLDEYISSMALYANRGFLSKDTLFKGFASPSLQNLELRKDNFAYDKTDDHRVVFVKIVYDFSGNATQQIISLDNAVNDPGSLVLNDYWTFLSREAIRNGVGVIDLFFREVEREKQTGNLKQKNTSEAERRAKRLAERGFSLLKGLYGSSLTAKDVAELNGNAAAAAILAVEPEPSGAPQPVKTAPTPPSKAAEPIPFVEVLQAAVEPPVPETVKPPPAPPVPAPPPPATPGIQELFPVPPGGGGGGPPPPTVSSGEQAAAPSVPAVPAPSTPNAPAITSPQEGLVTSATSIQLEGTADADTSIAISYQDAGATTTATTTANGTGAWALTISPQEGAIQVYITATDSQGTISPEAARSFVVDRTAPDVSGAMVLECGYLLRAACTVVGSAHVRMASSSPDMAYFSVAVDGIVVATSPATDISAALSAGTHQVEIAAYDSAGNGATSTAVAVESISSPIVVNEVAWSGTPADASAQWIEVHNRSSTNVSLTHVAVSFGAAEPIKLSGTIAAGAYYLIERADGDISAAADVVDPSLSLANPVPISLLYAPGGLATTSLDSTPASDACGGLWCDGASGATPSSMERTQVNVAGDLSTNWNSNDGIWRSGTDANGTALNGTPKAQNSQSLNSIGYFCEPEMSTFAEGGYYRFGEGTQGRCTYQSSNFGGSRYGVVFVGTVGSSTALSFHFLGSANEKFELEPAFTDPVQGMDLFATVFVPRLIAFNDDVAAFTAFFERGTPPPTLEYGILRFKWGASP